MTQRPQHLMRRAASTRRVFFWEEPIWHEAGENSVSGYNGASPRLEVLHVEPRLWVVRPHLTQGMDAEAAQRRLLDELLASAHIDRFIAWFYSPMALAFAAHLAPTVCVYDCMDELTGFFGAPPDLAERERALLDHADVVFTGGISLYESKRTQHPNVHAFPSSIEAEHFAQARTGELADPADQAGIPHPRAGFYGVLDERLDTELLASLARLRPSVHFILLGPVVKIDPATLPQAANLHYLGAKDYNELPAYLTGWDVALLPFALNAATRFISPTKTPEYLAAGKPVISTPIHDVIRGYGAGGLVAIAGTPDEFAQAIDKALQPPSAAWKSAVDAKLRQSSWDSTWSAMQQEIGRISLRPAASLTGGSALGEASPHAFAQDPAPPQDVLDARDTLDALDRDSWLASRQPKIAPAQGREKFDYLVVGAGFAGSVLAERLASQLGKRVLVIDQRPHLAGNAYDVENADGILIHRYGPHIFHTNSDAVVEYLSHFTQWRPYEHRVLSSVDGKLLPIPINLDTLNELYDLKLDAEGMKSFLDARRVPCPHIRTSEELVISRVGRDLYEKFFQNYTRKQWGLDPSELDSGVAGRIPVRFNHDDRYFTDTFQAMPLRGYTAMFERMLDHPRITFRPGVAYADAERTYPNATIIYTGPIDEYFQFRFGKLPYRSLAFKHETHNREVFQKAPVINYPNDQRYTRITEFKYLTGQTHRKTSIVYEFPTDKGDPYYPVPRPENALLAARYKELAQQQPRVHFCGRLANYQYLNMDQVVAQALALYREIAARETSIRIPPVPVVASLGKTSLGEGVAG